MVKTGQVWIGSLVTRDATGALATPSVGPAGVLYVDGVADAASVTISGTNPYKWSVTLPALTAGQSVSMYITATIATITTGAIVAEDQADTARISDVETDTADIQARLPAALVSGRMDATVGAMAANTLTASALATDAVTEISTAISSTAGSGALTTTVTVNDENAQPLDGVEVWVTSDSAGTTVVAGTLTTNAAGVVTFMLDAGTYYLWRQLSRYNFTNPTTIVVS